MGEVVKLVVQGKEQSLLLEDLFEFMDRCYSKYDLTMVDYIGALDIVKMHLFNDECGDAYIEFESDE